MNQIIQIQQENSTKTLDRARLIASAKRVRRSEVNRNIWLVGSGNPKTPKRFYIVKWNEVLDCFECDCKAFAFSCPTPCKHVFACAIYEGGLA